MRSSRKPWLQLETWQGQIEGLRGPKWMVAHLLEAHEVSENKIGKSDAMEGKLDGFRPTEQYKEIELILVR